MAQLQFLIREEEKSSVAAIEPRQDDRPPQNPTKIVLSKRGAPQVVAVAKPIIGIGGIVPEVVEQRAVELVGPGTRDDRDLPSGHPAILGGIARGLNPELLQCVDRDEAVGAPGCVESRQGAVDVVAE